MVQKGAVVGEVSSKCGQGSGVGNEGVKKSEEALKGTLLMP